MRKRMQRKPNALAVAKRALKLAGQVANGTVETKYLSYSETSDLVNNAQPFWGSAIGRELTSLNGTTPLWNASYLTGNKAYFKGVKGTWEIHMDSLQNEEETVNFTVAVIQPKSDADRIFNASGVSATSHISTIQGQTYFDPRYFKIHYYRHFTRTMGGVQPGTAGESLAKGSFYIPINKMVRLSNEGATGSQSSGSPVSTQDRMYFFVSTDNSSVDLENPRINYRTLLIAKDVDFNSG